MFTCKSWRRYSRERASQRLQKISQKSEVRNKLNKFSKNIAFDHLRLRQGTAQRDVFFHFQKGHELSAHFARLFSQSAEGIVLRKVLGSNRAIAPITNALPTSAYPIVLLQVECSERCIAPSALSRPENAGLPVTFQVAPRQGGTAIRTSHRYRNANGIMFPSHYLLHHLPAIGAPHLRRRMNK